MKRTATRTIKDGRVKIYDRYFYPDDRYMKYDGRLDSMRYVFGLYYTGDALNNMVSLIIQEGSPTRFDPDDPASHSTNRPEVVNGSIPWLFWRTVD